MSAKWLSTEYVDDLNISIGKIESLYEAQDLLNSMWEPGGRDWATRQEQGIFGRNLSFCSRKGHGLYFCLASGAFHE